MPLFRKSRVSQIDQMGPGDVLLAAAGTLKSANGPVIVQRAVLDDEVHAAAHQMLQRLTVAQYEKLSQLAEQIQRVCKGAARATPGQQDLAIKENIGSVLMGCREVLDIRSNDPGDDQEGLLALVTLRGVTRMFELHRPSQADQTLGYGLTLVLYFTMLNVKSQAVGVPEQSGPRHHAQWGNNGCSFDLTGESPTWRFDENPKNHFDHMYAEAALAQMEKAYGRSVSFPQAEESLLSLLTFPYKTSSEETNELQLAFKWDPPLPTA